MLLQVDSISKFGQTALSIAAENKYFETVQYLVLEGNASLNIKDIEGMTELHRAVTGWSICEQSDEDLDSKWGDNPTSRKYKLCKGDEFSFNDGGNKIVQHSDSASKFYQKFVFFPSQNITSADRYSFHLRA